MFHLVAELMRLSLLSRSYQRKLVKSAKPKKKTDNKKPILIVRRYFDYKNRHTSTTVDIKSKGLVDVLIDCNDDVEGLGLNQNPPSVRILNTLHGELKLGSVSSE